ncbi:MAG TPA: 16S rRNA (guanine(966)-N(2))-methyltransferase RsmD [Bacteroidetes bacterium]|nr:16S rRNA (guanine(966)-N(2))-methyltransferase RsmD [Bacteroidota bacterium]
MRIISGKYRGKILHPPSGLRVRPTTDFAREALFNLLSNHFDLPGLEVLDLFSGTGSIGFEFASRGAALVQMVEQRDAQIRFIRKTISELHLESCLVYRGNVFLFLRKKGLRYDVVFADPPYDMEGIDLLPDRVLEGNFLKPEGWFILEHGRKNAFDSHPRFRECRKYGSVHFSIFE